MHWNWKVGGLALGLTFVAAVWLVKPIGVSTQYVIADGVAARLFHPGLVRESSETRSGWTSSNPYLAKSGGAHARAVAHPLTYGLVFVLSIAAGGLLGRLRERRIAAARPETGRPRPAGGAGRRTFLAFAGGVLVLWGARLAGGCTSGHMMSGMMQGAVSGWAFAAAVFAAAIPTALAVRRPGGDGR